MKECGSSLASCSSSSTSLPFITALLDISGERKMVKEGKLKKEVCRKPVGSVGDGLLLQLAQD